MRIGCVISDSRHLAWAEECAFDYLEVKGDFILQLFRTGNLDKLLEFEPISLEAMTSPLPRELGSRIVGNNADHTYALKVFTQMVDLAAMLGIRKIVLGSGQARAVPVHFKRDWAYEQLIDFVNKAKCVCIDRKQMLSIEPLHSGETNLINSCVEAQRVIKDVPEISITADCYHIFTEQLSLNDELYKSKITHAHTSYLPRGSGVFREAYQRSFLKKLQAIGCNDISIEESFISKRSMCETLLKLRKLNSML
ncbi:sugar phosphate isomerase/epimerase family protein [Photorhabdus heterorhabditis]|uniref:sugar phosphate isomerase/epimerase family protein n=1 Tax=Photorhabdus heterorhabditis TaxID=880156 RepID=UPI001561C9CA|nr:TIM barrel protein [Photorhabdus heterorhabditis]NRN27053.1 TIM barrel protein [Photorhabdus heterorhabditis subsp. aluminescens]